MKRIIYILTAIFSAVTAALYIIQYIAEINMYVEYGAYFFDLGRCIIIAEMLALSILSLIQLKKHTPRLILILCGYAFIASSMPRGYTSFFGFIGTLLLLAALLTPAVYEFSHYGMMVRHEPKMGGQSRWRWLLKAAIALAAFRVLPFILQVIIAININGNFYTFESYSTDIMGISALICFAVFCGLMNRRTSGLYRMFFTGCILFDAIQTVFIGYNSFFSYSYPQDSEGKMLFVLFEILYVLFALLILIHALLTRRDGLVTREHTGVAAQTATPAA